MTAAMSFFRGNINRLFNKILQNLVFRNRCGKGVCDTNLIPGRIVTCKLYIYTPQKLNMDTKNEGLQKVFHFRYVKY